MEKTKLEITQDAIGDFVMVSQKPVKAERMALYVAKDRSMWLYDLDLASRILNNRRMEYEIERIGKTKHVIIYPANEIFIVDDTRYVVGECLIMNLEEFGLRCMTREETQKAFNEYMYRTKTVCQGRYRTYAYLLD